MKNFINLALLPVKLQYFLRFAGSEPLYFLLPAIIHQKGIPFRAIGVIYAAVPLASLFTNVITGIVADAYKIHKAFLLAGLTSLTIGVCGNYFIPSRMEVENPIQYATANKLSLNEGFQNLIYQINDTNHNTTGQVVVSTGIDLLCPNCSFDVKNNNHSYADLPSDSIMGTSVFWLVFTCVLLTFIGQGTCIIFLDDACYKILGSNHDKYGQQRIWGTIGTGISCVCVGALIDWFSQDSSHKSYLVAYIAGFVIMVITIVLATQLKESDMQKKENLSFAALKNILRSRQTVIYLATIIVFGYTCNTTWTFRAILVEDIAHIYDPNFSSLNLLRGVLLFVETFAGEIPFMFYSGIIIKRFGHEVVFFGCLLSISLRYFLYFTLSNPWWILPIEILNGPSFGLFQNCMVSYATVIAEPGAIAAVYAIAMACFALGQSAGGFIGGELYERIGGSQTYLISSYIVISYSVIYGLTHILYKCISTTENESVENDNYAAPPTTHIITRRASESSVKIYCR